MPLICKKSLAGVYTTFRPNMPERNFQRARAVCILIVCLFVMSKPSSQIAEAKSKAHRPYSNKQPDSQWPGKNVLSDNSASLPPPANDNDRGTKDNNVEGFKQLGSGTTPDANDATGLYVPRRFPYTNARRSGLSRPNGQLSSGHGAFGLLNGKSDNRLYNQAALHGPPNRPLGNRLRGGALNLHALGLSDEQKQRIRQMRRQHAGSARQLRQSLKAKRQEMRQLMFNPDATEAQIRSERRQLRHMQDQMDDMVMEDFLSIRSVLTPAQRRRLPEIMPRQRPGRRQALASPYNQNNFQDRSSSPP